MKITILVRELKIGKPDYSLLFELPEVPRVNDYISIQRPDIKAPLGEDLIVVDIWWRLSHSNTAGFETAESRLSGKVDELIVECEPVVGPWSSKKWRKVNKDAPTMPFKRFGMPDDFDDAVKAD